VRVRVSLPRIHLKFCIFNTCGPNYQPKLIPDAFEMGSLQRSRVRYFGETLQRPILNSFGSELQRVGYASASPGSTWNFVFTISTGQIINQIPSVFEMVSLETLPRALFLRDATETNTKQFRLGAATCGVRVSLPRIHLKFCIYNKCGANYQPNTRRLRPVLHARAQTQ